MPRVYKDLVLTNDLDRGAADGQWPTVSGDLLRHRILLRLASTPGELTYRPEYGAGVETHVGYAASPARLAALQRVCRQAALAEAEVLSARVSITAPDRESPNAVTVTMAITRRNEQTETLVAFGLDMGNT